VVWDQEPSARYKIQALQHLRVHFDARLRRDKGTCGMRGQDVLEARTSGHGFHGKLKNLSHFEAATLTFKPVELLWLRRIGLRGTKTVRCPCLEQVDGEERVLRTFSALLKLCAVLNLCHKGLAQSRSYSRLKSEVECTPRIENVDAKR